MWSARKSAWAPPRPASQAVEATMPAHPAGRCRPNPQVRAPPVAGFSLTTFLASCPFLSPSGPRGCAGRRTSPPSTRAGCFAPSAPHLRQAEAAITALTQFLDAHWAPPWRTPRPPLPGAEPAPEPRNEDFRTSAPSRAYVTDEPARALRSDRRPRHAKPPASGRGASTSRNSSQQTALLEPAGGGLG